METIGAADDAHCLIGCYMVTIKGKVLFLADATVNVYPDSRTLAEIAVQTAKVARRFGVDPKVAMLSFSNFGSTEHNAVIVSKRLLRWLGFSTQHL